MKMREQELINEFKRGNKKAFEAIYNEHFVAIYLFAKRFVINEQAAEDITTEAFVTLWKRREDFKTRENILAFLYITARNACLNQLRTEQRHLAAKKELHYLLSAETEQLFEQHQLTATIYQRILDEMEKLPRQLKKVFKLAYIEGLSNEEIAAKLKISNQSVRNHKTRALKLLRLTLLDKGLYEWALLLFFTGFLNHPTI